MTAGEAQQTTSPSVAPAEPALAQGSRIVGRIQADTFCSACYYNLFGLDVWSDCRLGIAVVRCPECGKFQSAGVASGAGRVWLTRLGTFLVSFWVFALLVGVLVMGLAMMFTDLAQYEAFSQYQWNGVVGTITLDVATTPQGVWAQLMLQGFLWTLAIGFGFILGAGGAVGLSHLKRRWLGLLGLVPVGALILLYILAGNERYQFTPSFARWVALHHALLIALQCLGITAGVLVGRSLARGVLLAVVSRRLVQYLRFLWDADGKPMPGMHD